MSEKLFVYLVQAAENLPYENLQCDSSEVILLTWKKPSDYPGAVFYPDSTWNEGRNRLLEEAKLRAAQNKTDYLYYIFMDEDCQVEEDKELAASLNIKLTGNPFRTFEQCLLKWQPAVGYTRYDWQHYIPDTEVNLGYNFDANFNAFHREALDVLLPYYTGFDAESWLYSQLLICHLSAMFYNSHRLQFNILKTENLNRQGYQIRKKYWQIPTTFLVNSITSNLVEKVNTNKPNSPEPLSGEALLKNASYLLAKNELMRHTDVSHPLFNHRSITAINREKKQALQLKDCRVALCMSGSCRGLTETWPSFKEFVLDNIGEWDLFMYAPDDEHAHLAADLKPKVLKTESDSPIDEQETVNGEHCILKNGLQPYLQQLFGLQKCYELMSEHINSTGAEYDLVIRCRPDLLFVAPIDSETIFDPWYVHVPDFHQFEGCNDRFAIGSVSNMEKYMEQFAHFHDYIQRWHSGKSSSPPVSAEMYTAGHLRNMGVPVRQHPFRFHRVRSNRVCLDAPPALNTRNMQTGNMESTST